MSYLRGPFSKNISVQYVLSLLGIWILCFAPSVLHAQDDLNIHGVVSDAMTSSKLDGVKVTVKKNGTNHDTFTTRANGKYEFYLDCDSKYELIFDKDGYVERSIVIDARNVPAEIIGAGIIMPTDMSMYAITEAMEGEDLSVFQQPIGKAKYDPAEGDLVWDFNYTNKVKGEIMTLMRDVEKKQKNLDKEQSAADKAKEAEEAKFNQFVKDGDIAASKKHYQDAVLNYKAALEIKPDNLEVKGKLGDAETKWNAEKAAAEKEASYAAALDAGDGYMRTEEFDKAIEQYQAALTIKPGEKYPTDQITEAQEIIKERKANMAKQEKFNALMAEADASFSAKEYSNALTKFQEAQKVIPDNKEVAQKIEDTKSAIANKEKMAKLQADYDALIASADEKYKTEKFETALADYEAASKLLPDETYPAERISACNVKIAEKAEMADKQASFDDLMKAGNDALTATDYTTAVEKYNGALGVFPDDAKAKAKLKEAQSLLDEKNAAAETQAAYDGLILEADDLYKDEKLTEAKSKYQEAHNLMAEETYPMDQITKIDAQIKENAEKQEAQEAYDNAMAAGSAAETESKYDEAITQYQTALDVMEGDKAAQKALDNAKIRKAEFDKNQAADAQYTDLLASADEKFGSEKYEEARSDYQEALKIKPDEEYPNTQLTLIDTAIAEKEKAAAEAEEQARIQAEYEGFMTAGNSALEASKYDEAITQFENALGLKEGDKTATEKRDEAQTKLTALKGQQAIDEQYDSKIAEADKLLADNALEDAKTAYEAAGKIKSEEAYPKDQIALIDEKIASERAAAEEAEMKAKTDQVAALVLEGDNLVKANSFQDGIAKYEEALTILPDRADVKKKRDDATAAMLAYQEAQGIQEVYDEAIAEADKAYKDEDWASAKSGYQNALSIKSGEQYPKDQISDIDAKVTAAKEAEMKAKTDQVNALVLEGDNLVKANSFQDGIAKYEEALTILPDRADIKKKRDDATTAMLAYQEAQGTQEAYDDAIAAADKAYKKADWTNAKSGYQNALNIKSEEQYPKDQITEIDAKIAAEESAAEAARQQELQAQFDDLIKEGDKDFKRNRYDGALQSYQSALDLLPGNEVAMEKIGAVNEILGNLDAQAKAQQKYEALVAEGDELFDAGSFEMARLKFLDAQELMPDEKYPPKKITDIDIQLEKQRLADAQADADALNKKYNDAIRLGDEQLRGEDYDDAIAAYNNALALKPDEVYPKSQIERIELLKEDKAAAATAEAERLAARKEVVKKAPERKNQTLSNVNSNSEDQAEQFMREAREAQEQEKYERIKKKKEQYAENNKAYKSEAEALREENRQHIESFKSGAENQYAESVANREEQVSNSVKYKKALLQSQQMRAETSDVQRKDNYAEIQKSEENRSEWILDRQDLHEKKIQKEVDLKEAQLEQLHDWSEKSAQQRLKISEKFQKETAKRYSENKVADDLREERAEAFSERKEEVLDQRAKRSQADLEKVREAGEELQQKQENYSKSMSGKNDEKVNTAARQIDQQRQQTQNATEVAKDRADKRRAENLEKINETHPNEPKDYNDYFRSQLAENYPQGVSEESSTLGNKVIITRIVVRGNKGDEYKKVLDKSGNYYFKNGQSISEHTWNRETIEAFNTSKD